MTFYKSQNISTKNREISFFFFLDHSIMSRYIEKLIFHWMTIFPSIFGVFRQSDPFLCACWSWISIRSVLFINFRILKNQWKWLKLHSKFENTSYETHFWGTKWGFYNDNGITSKKTLIDEQSEIKKEIIIILLWEFQDVFFGP